MIAIKNGRAWVNLNHHKTIYRKELSHMAIIPQLTLFSWNDLASLGERERLQLVIDTLPDEPLMRKLEKVRGAAPPPASAYTRFLGHLMKEIPEIEGIFDRLVEALAAVLPEFGQDFATDSKAIAVRPAKNPRTPDGRRDLDADFGKKNIGGREDGTVWSKIVSGFCYKLHLLVDATYELPVA